MDKKKAGNAGFFLVSFEITEATVKY